MDIRNDIRKLDDYAISDENTYIIPLGKKSQRKPATITTTSQLLQIASKYFYVIF